MKNPKIRIHLGHTKCGSTSIQKCLSIHAAQYKVAGFMLPRTPKVKTEDLGLSAFVGLERTRLKYQKHYDLPQSTMENFECYFQKLFTEEVGRAAGHTIILSHEGLFPRNSAEANKLLQLLKGVSNDIRAFVVLRRQDRWAISSYNTRLSAHGTFSKQILRNDSGRIHGLNYFQKLKMWEDLLGKEALFVTSLEDHQDILQPFFEFIGFRPNGYEPLRNNLGMSAYSQEVLRVFNEMQDRKGYDPQNQLKTRKALRKILPTGNPIRPGAAEVAPFLEHFRRDNTMLKGTFLPKDSKFFLDSMPYDEHSNRPVLTAAEPLNWLQRLAQR